MRRNVGISSLQRLKEERAYTELKSHLNVAQTERLSAELAAFRSLVIQFIHTHKMSAILADPRLRSQFVELCYSVGIDPLSYSKSGGLWSMLGLHDFSYALAIQIIDICVQTRPVNGGMIALDDLCSKLNNLRGPGNTVAHSDIHRAVKTLKPLDCGYSLIDIGDRRSMLRSVPAELDLDSLKLFQIISAIGYASHPVLEKEAPAWNRQRAQMALDKAVLMEGLLWVDDQADDGWSRYYLPSSATID